MLTVSRSAVDFSGLGGIWDGPSHSGNVYCGQMNQYFRYFWEEWTPCAPDQEKKRIIQTVTSNKSKSQGLSWYGVVSVPLAKVNLHFCDGTINAEKYIEIWSTICCLQEDIFSRDVHAYFQQGQCKTTFCTHYKVLAAGGRGYGYLTGLPAVLTCLQ